MNNNLIIFLSVAFAILGAVALTEHMAGRSFYGCNYSKSRTDATEHSKRFPARLENGSLYEPVSCEKPKATDQENLCEQRRSAIAAEDQACAAWLQFWLGMAGLAGLLATLAYNAMQVALLRNEQRPWLTMRPTAFVRSELDSSGDLLRIQTRVAIAVQNSGPQPAINVDLCVSLHFVNDFNSIDFAAGRQPTPLAAFLPITLVPPGTPLNIERQAALDIPSGHMSVVVILAVQARYIVHGVVRHTRQWFLVENADGVGERIPTAFDFTIDPERWRVMTFREQPGFAD